MKTNARSYEKLYTGQRKSVSKYLYIARSCEMSYEFFSSFKIL